VIESSKVVTMFVSRGSIVAGTIMAGVVTMHDVIVVVDAVSSSENHDIVTQRYDRIAVVICAVTMKVVVV
jgi:hypothetical protein